MSRKTLLLVGAIFAIAAGLLSSLGYSSNCGGNSAALAHVHVIALIARVGTLDTLDHLFRFTAADADQREQLSRYSRTHWLRGARFLVSKAAVSAHEAQPRRVIVVCDTPYRNVPRQLICSAPPSHAAGFADGSYGLISTAEFAALDRSTFAPLDELYPTNPK